MESSKDQSIYINENSDFCNKKNYLGKHNIKTSAELFSSKDYFNVDDLLNSILAKELKSDDLTNIVDRQWKNGKFVFNCSDYQSLKRKINSYANNAVETFHGRQNQVISTSKFLFGNNSQVAARLVYDPPELKNIELHKHPVDSLILVTSGAGKCLLHYHETDIDLIVEIDLSEGDVLIFPANVTHTLKIGCDGLETLNITSHYNQPEYNYEKYKDSKILHQLPKPSPKFSTPINEPLDIKQVQYEKFLKVLKCKNSNS